MSFEMPKVPAGSGKCPIAMAVISANNLAASTDFYAKLFGWQSQPMSAELVGFMPPAGPTGALRSGIPTGFPGVVPYLGVADIDGMLKRIIAAGGTIERAPWAIPGVGQLARFADPSGTVYGLTTALDAQQSERADAVRFEPEAAGRGDLLAGDVRRRRRCRGPFLRRSVRLGQRPD